MKPSELKYITQDIIDKGTFNVTSPEMMSEARRYNMAMVTNAAKRRRVDVITGAWIFFQIPIRILAVCAWLMTATIADWSAADAVEVITSWARLGLLFLGLFAYLGLMGYYIIFRGMRDQKTMVLCSVPAVFTTATGIITVMINFFAGLWYTRTDEILSEEAGYPGFVRLNVTTVESDSDSVLNMTYDSIKERAKLHRRDEGDFLS